MKISLATNFDNRLLDEVYLYPVEDVYGKLSSDFVGGGRASYSTQGITPALVRSHVAYAHSKGLKFTYLLNSACCGNREWTGAGLRKIRGLLDWLASMDVDGVTVSLPFLAELVKRKYPRFFLKIGVFANIDSPERALFWQDLGADMLTLESFSINRNFAVLRAIREAVSCRLQLIANFLCLSRCPMQPYHMNGLSHGSAGPDRNPFIDYCALSCSYRMLKDPRQLIKSQWIRPEDIKRYEDIGYRDFKLLERNAPTEALVRRVKAYARRKSSNNLLEILQPYGFDQEMRTSFGWQARALLRFHGQVDTHDLMRLMKKRGLVYSLRYPAFSLNSRLIPQDFLERMSSAACSVSGSCTGCGYCRQTAAAAYSVEQEYRDECLALYEKVFEQLWRG